MAERARRAERIVLPRRSPSRALGRLAGFLGVATVACAALWLLFGEEPRRLPNGAVNLLAYLPHLAIVGFLVAGVPVVLAVFRRPLVQADSYALTVRPGSLRTLVLPWARISDVGVYPVTLEDDPEPVLLVRCVERHSRLGDTPNWWDQAVLRAAMRAAGGPIGGYDVGVRFSDFLGDHRRHLAGILAHAPARVNVIDRTAVPPRR